MEMKQGLKLGEIGQIALRTSNVEEATSFYRDILGLKLLFQMPNMAFFDCDGVRLMITLPENEQFDRPGSIIYFRTEDIFNDYQSLRDNDVTTHGEPHMIADMGDHGLWMAFFDDKDGNPLALMSEIRK